MSEGFSTEDMLDTYLLENQQLLEKIQRIILEQKDRDCFEEDAIHDIFRTMHTMKASSSVMMFDNITTIAHKLEDVFAVLRENHQLGQLPHMQLVELVLEVVDFITGELENIQNGEPLEGDITEIVVRLEDALKVVERDSCVVTKEETTEEREDRSKQRFYIAPVEKQENFGLDIFIDLESSVEEIEARAERTQKQIMAEARTKVMVPGDFVIETKETRKARRVRPDGRRFEKAAYMNVEIAKMDCLMELVDKLAYSQKAVLKNLDEADVTQIFDLTTELKQMVLSMRKTSLTQMFQKMNRVVFDVSRKLGKNIELIMLGESIEIDRNIIEHISDSLMHLVRNAADHGIETPEEKKRAGKFERSRIILSAEIELDKVLISVEDNGRGLCREKIIQKAREKDLIDLHKPEDAYTDEEVFGFITLPGFSTKDSITEYSGRGVGMDVVVSNIAAIGGTLDIESEEGKGTKMVLTIPITLENADGVVI